MTDPGTNPLGDKSTEPQLSRRQMLALPIIAAAPNLIQAARDAGISRATLQRWRQDENFQAELDRMTHEIAETTRTGLQSLIVDGLDVIKKLMQDPDPAVRLRAAQAAIILGIRVCDAEEYRNRAGAEEGDSRDLNRPLKPPATPGSGTGGSSTSAESPRGLSPGRLKPGDAGRDPRQGKAAIKTDFE